MKTSKLYFSFITTSLGYFIPQQDKLFHDSLCYEGVFLIKIIIILFYWYWVSCHCH